jgi:hypothetical protein
MNIFESEDEKNSRAKAILQYLILEEVFDNIGTERHLKTMEDGYKKETVKVNTYEASAKNVLIKAKELCFDFLVEDGLTGNFMAESKNKIIEEPILAQLHSRTPDAYDSKTIDSIAEIIEKKAKALQDIPNDDKAKLKKILNQKSLIDSIIVNDSIDDVSATKTSSDRGHENKKTRKVVDDLYNSSSTNAIDSINQLHAKFSPNPGTHSDPDIIKTSKTLLNNLHASLINTTSMCFGFISLGVKEVENIFSQQQKKPSATPSGTRTTTLLTPPSSSQNYV